MKTHVRNGIIVGCSMLIMVVASADELSLSKDTYLDKCKGAWVGQMMGVCFGDCYEFQSNGKYIEGDLKPWKDARIEASLGQDDCYVEMTFLKALEEHGVDVTSEQAGKAFAASKYPLWHANLFGRKNVQRGIMPPKSGSPQFNRHADDIDFQIEADLFGILCPALPHESNRLCDIFGHIMNYGDGVYGGMFVAGMYTAAYTESKDVEKVVKAGLACIPEQSTYRQCIEQVIEWVHANPSDPKAAWDLIEKKYNDDIDCTPKNPFNIDAKLNGAYVAMGLLYGNGNILKTMEIAVRCGQDTDCNCSNAAGVACCMKGYAAVESMVMPTLKKMGDEKFIYTDYSFNTLIPACQTITELLIKRAGGTVEEQGYRIPVQTPTPPATLEVWPDEEQKKAASDSLPQSEVNLWDPAWNVVACGQDMAPGVYDSTYGRDNVLLIHPVDREKPAILTTELTVPATKNPSLVIPITSHEQGDFQLGVLVDGKPVLEKTIDYKGQWKDVSVDLAPFAGKKVTVQLENRATGWQFEAAYLGKIVVKE